MLLPELYALSLSRKCSGKFLCHWCGAPCGLDHVYLAPIQLVGTKKINIARQPASNHICEGCWLFRRPYVTIQLLNGGQLPPASYTIGGVRIAENPPHYHDRKSPVNYGWWVTGSQATAIVPGYRCPALYPLLLKPPLRFALALVDDGQVCHPQLTPVNDIKTEIKADDSLAFTVNNVPQTYTPYELEHAIRNGTEASPGVRELVRRLGTYTLPPLPTVAPGPDSVVQASTTGRAGKRVQAAELAEMAHAKREVRASGDFQDLPTGRKK